MLLQQKEVNDLIKYTSFQQGLLSLKKKLKKETVNKLIFFISKS